MQTTVEADVHVISFVCISSKNNVVCKLLEPWMSVQTFMAVILYQSGKPIGTIALAWLKIHR